MVWLKDIWKMQNIKEDMVIEKAFPWGFKPLNIKPLNNNSSQTAGNTAKDTIEIK